MRGSTRRQVWLTAALTVLVFAGMAQYAVYAGISAGSIVSQLLVSGVFAATGLAAWARRPQNRLGPLMVAFAWTFMAIVFTKPVVPLLVPLGLAAFVVSGTLLAYIVLAYPSGELRTTANRVLVAFTAIGIGVPRLVRMLATEQAPPGSGVPNPWYLLQNPAIAPAMDDVPYIADLVVVGVLLVVVIVRWARASGPLRRILSPVLLPTIVLVSTIIISTATVIVPVPDDVRELLDVVQLLTRMVLPIGFLVGILQTRMARSAVADLVVDLGSDPTPGRLGEALANALGDPTLEVGYWSDSEAGYVDASGRRLALPEPSAERGVTFLERDGTPLAAIVHDPALLDDPGLVAAVTSALRLAVENERLQEEVETQLDEVRASRARLVEASDAERKRIERDLHDGAQQRLVALTLALRLARTRAGGDIDPALAASLDEASMEARAALTELRELAHGIHPQILTGSGLGPAIESLAARAPIGVSVEVEPGRFPSAVEGAVYFAVSEALANIAKYAEAGHALVRSGWADGTLTVEISDDGIGGADVAGGSGLRGLADRLAALDGSLEVVSPRGGGTRIVGRIPTAPPTLDPSLAPSAG
jgi:signal transduction histidine kinase